MYESFREEYREAFNQYKDTQQYHSETIKRIVRLKQSTTGIMTKDDLNEIINNYNQEVLSKLIAISVVKINEEKEEVPSNSIEEISKKIAVALVKSTYSQPVKNPNLPPVQPLPQQYQKTPEEIQLIKTIVVAASEAKRNHPIGKDANVSPVIAKPDNQNTPLVPLSNSSKESIWKLYGDHFNTNVTTIHQMKHEVTTDSQIQFIQTINNKINEKKDNLKKFLTEKQVFNNNNNTFLTNLLRLSIYYNHYYIVKYLIGEEIDGKSINGDSINEKFKLNENFFKMDETFEPIDNIVKLYVDTKEETPITKLKLTLRDLAIKECFKIENKTENIIQLLIEEEKKSERYKSKNSKTEGGLYHSLIINDMVLTHNVKYIETIELIIETLQNNISYLKNIDKNKTNPNGSPHGPIIQLIGNYSDVVINLREYNKMDPEFLIFKIILNFFAKNIDTTKFHNSTYMQVTAEKCNLEIIKIIANKAKERFLVNNQEIIENHPIFINPAKDPECGTFFCRSNYPLVRSIKTLRDYEIIEYFLTNSKSILNKYVSNYGIKMAKSYYLYTPLHLIIKLYDKLYDNFNKSTPKKTPLDLIKHIYNIDNNLIGQKTNKTRLIGGLIYDNNINPIKLAEKYITIQEQKIDVINYLNQISNQPQSQPPPPPPLPPEAPTQPPPAPPTTEAQTEQPQPPSPSPQPAQSKSSISQQGFLRIPKELSDIYFKFIEILKSSRIDTPFNDTYSKLNKSERNRLNLIYKLIETYEKSSEQEMNELIQLIQKLIEDVPITGNIKKIVEKALNIHNEFVILINIKENEIIEKNKSFMYIIYFLHNATM